MADEPLQIGLDLAAASREVIEVLCDEAAGEDIFLEIARANPHRPEILRFLIEHPSVPESVAKEIATALNLPVSITTRHASAEAEVERVRQVENLFQKVGRMTVGEKILLAMKGGKEVRSILVKDTSKEVVKKVLENPRITDSEIELLTKSRSVSEEVLRTISKKKEWMKNYTIMSGLVSNPKTPAGIAVPFVKFLTSKDLDLIEKNKNVSQAVRVTAKKLLKARRPQ